MLDIFSPEAGRQAMAKLLEMSPRPTAVILASDILAIGAYAAIRRAGLEIPKDISLITLDDIDFAPYMDPPLTTVHIPAHEIGRLAGQYLAKLLNGESAKYQICLPTTLMLRSSAAEPCRDK
jgi:LacI family transcriptional regulator